MREREREGQEDGGGMLMSCREKGGRGLQEEHLVYNPLHPKIQHHHGRDGDFRRKGHSHHSMYTVIRNVCLC